MGADPRLNVFATPVIRPGASEADRALAVLGAQLATQARELADLRREVRDLRSAATVQVGAGPPTLAARDGTDYIDSTNLRRYTRIAGAWRWLGPYT